MSYKILQKSCSSRLNQGNDTAYEYAEIGTSRRGAAATAAATEQMDEPGPQPKRGPGGEGSFCELQRQPHGLEDRQQRFPSSAAPGHCTKCRCLGPPSVFTDPGCGPQDSVELFGSPPCSPGQELPKRTWKRLPCCWAGLWARRWGAGRRGSTDSAEKGPAEVKEPPGTICLQILPLSSPCGRQQSLGPGAPTESKSLICPEPGASWMSSVRSLP